MQTYLHGRDLIGDLDFSKEEVETVLDVAFDLKRKRALNEPHPYLRDKVLAMLFFFSSTRTRGSFEAGMAQLGGHAAFIESRTTQIAHGDTEKEMGEIFGRYFDGIAIRHVDWGVGNRYINLVAQASRVPVLNMQCDIYHPFQILADLMTIIEKKGNFWGIGARGLRRVGILSGAFFIVFIAQYYWPIKGWGILFATLGPLSLGFATAAIVLTLWQRPACLVSRGFSLRPFAYFGQISYGLYLFHPHCIAWSSRYFGHHNLKNTFVGLLATLGVAMVSWHAFEKPINNLKNRFAYGARQKVQVDDWSGNFSKSGGAAMASAGEVMERAHVLR